MVLPKQDTTASPQCKWGEAMGKGESDAGYLIERTTYH